VTTTVTEGRTAVPELPEVETVRRDLLARVVGRRIVSATVTGKRTVRRQTAAQLCAALEGRTVSDARRRGKYLFAPLDDGAALVVHLRMSGQLRLVPQQRAGAATDPHTHAVLSLDDGSELRFVDPRTFGELFVTSDLRPGGLPEALASLGVDPLTDGVDTAVLVRLVALARTTVKAFLLDQRRIAGIGNLYADEICFRAGILPARRTETLQAREVRAIGEALVSVLDAAVQARGSTLRDARYRDLAGNHGSYQQYHCVYGRAGGPCPRCGSTIVSSRVAGRSAHYCPSCQT
jgi:formamidopyrimidine-DNA glycosylase